MGFPIVRRGGTPSESLACTLPVRLASLRRVRVLSVVGTRPNFVKSAPVITELLRRDTVEHTLVHTGQHYDRMMSEIFLEQLGVPEPDHVLNVGSGSHALQAARVLGRLGPILEAERPDVVLVPGDVNSTMAASLATVQLGIPLGHIESGLRSFDRTMPEENNRVVADHLSEFLFFHSAEARENLLREGLGDRRLHFVGNTMIDSLVAVEERFRALAFADHVGVPSGQYLLVTLHRPALVDGHLLVDVVAELNRVARDMPVVFPVHPRTAARMDGIGLHPDLRAIKPVGYLEFLSLQADAAAVLTDSGGVQEETTHLGVPCFTLRDNTERPVTLRAGTNQLLGLNPARIAEIPPAVNGWRPRVAPGPELWDGRASERLVDALIGEMESVTAAAGTGRE